MSRTLDARYAAMKKPGYKKQRNRTVSGVRLIQQGVGSGGKWITDDGKFYLQESEHEEGGWYLFGPRVERGAWFRTLKLAVAWIALGEPHPSPPTPTQGESE